MSEYVHVASSGPSAAFFDLDRTLISGSSAFTLARAAQSARLMPTRELLRDALGAALFKLRGDHGNDVAADARDRIERAIDAGRASYAITCGLQLPFLITKPDDVLAFRVAESVPNFVTQGRVTAAVATNLTATSITGRIVLIESADPGYDWIFAHGPAGLITAFGGTNSHMAIRANELALPAVVGVGEKMYRRLAGARAVTIDCAERRVFPT